MACAISILCARRVNWRRNCVWWSCRWGRRSCRRNVYCTLAPRSWLVSFFDEWLLWGDLLFFLFSVVWGGGGRWWLMFNLSQLYAYLIPIPPPLHTALCFVQFLVLQAKHSSSFSQNPSRQGPSWLARHFCNNYPSALDLVLALALVALVLGVIYRGSIVLRLFNWSFDFWFVCYWICQAD
jgi:hypothetical protein